MRSNRTRAIWASVPTVPCTSCGYCVEGCPEGVRIPSALYALNIMTLFDDMPMASHEYDWRTAGGRASSCIECGACELACPQHIEVMKELARAAELLEIGDVGALRTLSRKLNEHPRKGRAK